MLHQFLQTWLGWVENWGYLGVVILMAMESSIFPVPSEVVIPPAAILAASTGKMSLAGVILAGTFGSWLGSAITYFVARSVGRPVVEKWGKYFFIPPDKLARAEVFMRRYEAGGIFFARLLPVIRHLISIPAGIIRMGFGKFSALTTVGAAIWCSVLAWLGGKVGGQLRAVGKNPLDPDELLQAVKHESHLIIGGVFVLCVLYFVMVQLTALDHVNKNKIATGVGFAGGGVFFFLNIATHGQVPGGAKGGFIGFALGYALAQVVLVFVRTKK